MTYAESLIGCMFNSWHHPAYLKFFILRETMEGLARLAERTPT